jgi:hypothetical protein
MWQAADGTVTITHLTGETVAPVSGLPTALGTPTEIRAGSLAPTGDAAALVAGNETRTIVYVSTGPNETSPTRVDLDLSGPAPVFAWSSDGNFVLVGGAGGGFTAIDVRTGRSGPTGLPFTPAIAVG